MVICHRPKKMLPKHKALAAFTDELKVGYPNNNR